MFEKIKMLFHKIVDSRILNNPIKSWAVAISACAANAFMSTPYPLFTAIITSIPIFISGYADFRQIYIKSQRRIEDRLGPSQYFCIKHSSNITPAIGLVCVSSLFAYFFLTIFPNNSVMSSLENSSAYSNTIMTFLMSSLTTPSGITVLIATITSPVYRMIHNHYITKERNEIAKTRKIRTAEIDSILEEQPSLEAAGSSTYPLPNPIIELRSKGKQPSEHMATLQEQELIQREPEPQEREHQLSEHERALQRKEKELSEREIALQEQDKKLTKRESELQERERQLSEHESALQRKEKGAPSLQDISFLGRRRASSLPSQEKPTNINTQGKQPTAAPSCSSTI